MDLTMLKFWLLWCTILDYAVLIVWAVLSWRFRPFLRALMRIYGVADEQQADRLNLAGIMLFKIGILLFNLVPLFALLIAAK